MPRAKSPARRASPSAAPSAAVLLALAGLAGYAILYFGTRIDSYSTAAEPVTRWSLFWQSLLLIDVQIAYWFGDPPGISLLDRAGLLLAAAGWLVVFWAAGDLVLRGLRLANRCTRWERAIYAVALGWQCVALATLFLGLAGGLHLPMALILPALGVVLCSGTLWRRQRACNIKASPPHGEDAMIKDPTSRRWLVAAVPFAVVILLGGMLPPVEFDVREYHLQAPKEFFQQGAITFLPHNVYANMPLTAEMPALASMVVWGDWYQGALVGKTLIALCAPLTALALVVAGRQFFSAAAGAFAAVIYLSTIWIVRVSNLGLIDAVVGLYVVLALMAVARAQHPDIVDDAERDSDSNGGRWWFLAGLLAGGAVACKYPAALFLVAPFVLLNVFTHGKSGQWRPLGWFILGTAICCGPWLLKNALATGNPVYPLAAEIIPSATRTPERIAQWNRAHRPPNFSPADALQRAADVLWRSPWQSPLIVPFALLAGIAGWRRPSVRRLAGFVAWVFATWWLFTHRIDRFWVPVLPVLALLAGAGVVWSQEVLWRRGARVYVVAGLIFCFLLIVRGPVLVGRDPGRFVLPPGGYTRLFADLETLRTSPERADRWHLWLNDHVPRDARVLAVGDAQMFDLTAAVAYNTVFDANLLEDWASGRTPDELHRALVDHGITHVLVHWGEIARYRSPGNYGFSDFITPARFDEWQQSGVLAAPLPAIEGHSGQVFPVRPLPAQ